jgi:pSer/pThr/pTyr-binding forkhead associated (FHA) protein
MYKLLIKVSNQQKQLFSFGTSIMIGREEECNLVLPDPSISRQHAQIHIVGEEVIAEDLGSQNGIVVDGQRLRKGQRLPMKSKSEMQLGKFTLVLLTNSADDKFYRGRSISYLPEYDPSKLVEQNQADETLQLSAREATSILREQNLLNNACIVDETGKRNFPETSTVSFGSAATIKAKGMFVGKVAAEVSWNGKAHVLTKKGGFMCTVKVNDSSVSEHVLTVNDRILIGNSSFQYVLHSDK